MTASVGDDVILMRLRNILYIPIRTLTQLFFAEGAHAVHGRNLTITKTSLAVPSRHLNLFEHRYVCMSLLHVAEAHTSTFGQVRSKLFYFVKKCINIGRL